MGLATLTRRLTRRRAQLTFFSGLAIASLMAVAFLATQVFMKLDEYGAARQDNLPWSISRLEVEQLKLLSALRDLDPAQPENLDLVNRRFDALYSRANTIAVGQAYHAIRTDTRAQQTISDLTGGLASMVAIMDRPDRQVYANRDALIKMGDALSAPIRRLAAFGITTSAETQEEERRLLMSKLLQVTGLSMLLLIAMISLAALLWQLYRLYRQRALENRQVLHRLTTILDTSQDAVLVVCKNGQVIDTNRAANEMFFGGEKPASPPMISDILLRKGADGGLGRVSGEKLHASCADGPNLCANVMGQPPSGEVFPIEMSADTAQRGGQTVVVCFLRNITRRVADQAALLAARDKALSGEQAKARFLSMVSHEMRTPLTGMLGALDLMDDTQLSDKQKTYAEIMQNSGQLLLNQINDALDVAQADQGELALSDEVFDLDAMLDTLLRSQEPLARDTGNRLELATPPHALGAVKGDSARVNQVLLNLVSNALKFTRDGDVTVEAIRLAGPEGDSDLVEFQVADTGIGIAEDAKARIFEDFVRLDAPDAHKAEGTGLGLGIVRNLVVLMGGEIGVESEPGEGSLFWVRLPLPRARQQEQIEPVVARPVPVGPCDVLIVEDNEINRAVLTEMLEKDGHRVTQAGDGADGVALAERRAFDVILMDINMPVLDGIEAARRIRALGRASAQAQIIALTAHVTPDIHARVTDAGMDAVLTKPLRREDLSRAISGQPAVADTLQLVVVDSDVLHQLRDSISAASLRALLDGFEAQGGALMADLESGVTMDAARIHDLAGLAATVGARGLHGALSDAEAALRSGDIMQVNEALSPLPALWDDTQTQLAHQRSAA